MVKATKQTLMKYQRNEIYKLLEEFGLNPLDFELKETDSEGKSWDVGQEISNKNSDYFFRIDRFGEGPLSYYVALYYPTHSGEMNDGELFEQWQEFKQKPLTDWLSVLQKELNEPDLWSQARQYSQAFNPALPQDMPNTPFSYQEADQIAEALSKLTRKIDETLNLEPEHRQYVESKVDFLIEKVKHQGRTTWIHSSVDVMVSIMLYLALTPESAGILWDIFKETIGPALGNLLRLPPN